MEAELGHNPSYLWGSLLATTDIIRAGSQWKVGDGRRIKVAVDKWLTHKPVFIGEDQTTMLVSELIDEDTGQWNKQKVHDLFAPSTQSEILAIPLNVTSVVNSLKQILTCYGNVLWHETCGQYWKEGCKTVATRCMIFFHLFQTLKDKLTTKELEQWATTSWVIWNARNKYYFEKVQM